MKSSKDFMSTPNENIEHRYQKTDRPWKRYLSSNNGVMLGYLLDLPPPRIPVPNDGL